MSETASSAGQSLERIPPVQVYSDYLRERPDFYTMNDHMNRSRAALRSLIDDGDFGPVARLLQRDIAEYRNDDAAIDVMIETGEISGINAEKAREVHASDERQMEGMIWLAQCAIAATKNVFMDFSVRPLDQ